MLHIDYQLTKKDSTKIKKKLEQEKLTLEQYIQKLIDSDINSTINLGKGFYYDSYLNRFFDSKKNEITFTKLEKKLVLTLLQDTTKIFTIDEIREKVWKKDNATVYTIRNIINKIRTKTFYELFENYSNKGYSLNIPKGNK
ncbi:helix-turn-helix domain-containing protein [Arcobacter arenosus]|uniref:Helix-turn-helix domain-containing protein n=1 Tax=Arcobacter arenosus TaxID=2576037 RepID=A0A5R8XY02_9BACT|nr:helix-turn-helix domain-containing protein [Arcobacter arenosus]TLP36220.1 helix-turn-helix domain-containing protein [Arcobacter arenosus]